MSPLEGRDLARSPDGYTGPLNCRVGELYRELQLSQQRFLCGIALELKMRGDRAHLLNDQRKAHERVDECLTIDDNVSHSDSFHAEIK